MNKTILTLSLVISLFLIQACQNHSTSAANTNQPQPISKQHNIIEGKVTQTMDSGGYTYVAVENNGTEVWAATKAMKVSVGDTAQFAAENVMNNFTSKTLNRTFSSIYFVSSLQINGAKIADHTMPQTAVAGQTKTDSATVKSEPIEKPKGGYSIEEIYSKKDSLAGKTVTVRGRVVKFTPNIMGTNWIHLQDNTGTEGTNDLTITSTEQTKLGDVITAVGQLTTNKDFGAGYVYAAIVEKAQLK